ncbi:MAG: hypothetical protein IKJ95_04345 [Bacteroidaceae bacterium]|nr:hypothetical protein [Bacteroidaceae bacterium]MBR6679358.1 hypothetical protein [Phascolarctobacterium sp.]
MEFLKLIKNNYKKNIKGYIVLWALLLIPIIFCLIETIDLYTHEGGIEDLQRHYGEEYPYKEGIEPSHTGIYAPSLLLYSWLIIIYVGTISQLNEQSSRIASIAYLSLSAVFYSAILYAIVYWTSHITLLAVGGGAASRETIAYPWVLQTAFLHFFIPGLIPAAAQFTLNKLAIKRITGNIAIRVIGLLAINVAIIAVFAILIAFAFFVCSV